MITKLKTDRLAFPIVKSIADLILAVDEEHLNVRVDCKCGKSFVTAIANANRILHGQCSCIGAPQQPERSFLNRNCPTT
jgi:hypothetical protein